MNILARIGKSEAECAAGKVSVQRSVMERAAEYAGRLMLPNPEGHVTLQLEETEPAKVYLLFLTDGTAAGSLDAGYAAGQAAAFLRFQGCEPEIMRGLPGDVLQGFLQKTVPMQCAAGLTFGRKRSGVKHKTEAADRFCICTEKRENWDDELLAFTKARYPKTFSWLDVSRKESRIYFSGRRISRKHMCASAFETGIAISNVMAAADELWLDLEMVQLEAMLKEKYLFGVCRKRDRRTVRKRCSTPEQTTVLSSVEARASYA